MTLHTDDSSQGKLQGMISSLAGVAGMIGPGLFTGVFSYFIGPATRFHQPGSAFFLGALFLLVGASIASTLPRKICD
jgi:DHA1 family tetracycline resistance protein-like MFS transporter